MLFELQCLYTPSRYVFETVKCGLLCVPNCGLSLSTVLARAQSPRLANHGNNVSLRYRATARDFACPSLSSSTSSPIWQPTPAVSIKLCCIASAVPS